MKTSLVKKISNFLNINKVKTFRVVKKGVSFNIIVAVVKVYFLGPGTLLKCVAPAFSGSPNAGGRPRTELPMPK